MRNKYSFSELLKTAYSFILTKLTIPQARLVRRPIYIRGGMFEGGRNLTTGRCCRFDLEGTEETLFIGKDCEIGDMAHIVAHEKVVICDNVLIASKCFISDTNHGTYKGEIQDAPNIKPNARKLRTSSVEIGSNVWIGENAVILAGSKIGDGCVIGANSVVSGTIPSFTIVGGVPAKILKQYDAVTGKWIRVKNVTE
ncbi:DapH/DapD/GlmU-related protein [Schaedlerella arabinosiphila]|jgi:acetyltransferase-like isoleucine patch superfamily enzyme|uniref:DapH/DapD/GlmU-related protein n=1 Tax=Schaedlerella arabinosiphila TaxID=2044587 RepID=UPI002557D2E5|nr:DapH/DapD/GlmU-related protein [Schaedlerella arabinosiphila]